jgi:Holliday junction resolvasome RuvABC endonuclease subunit
MGKGKPRPILPDGQRVLTLDLSSSGVGYAYGAGGVVLSYGKYVSSDKDGNGQLLLKFSKWLAQVINRLPAPPEIVVIEQPYLGFNPHTYSVLSKVVGVAEREVYRLLGYEPQFMTPSEVKSKLGIAKTKNHDKNKRNMVKKVNDLLGLDLKFVKGKKSASTKAKRSDDDVADALGMLLAWWLKHGIVAQNDENNDF